MIKGLICRFFGLGGTGTGIKVRTPSAMLPVIVNDQDTITVEMPFKLKDEVGGEASFSAQVTFKNEKGTLVLITPKAVWRVAKA